MPASLYVTARTNTTYVSLVVCGHYDSLSTKIGLSLFCLPEQLRAALIWSCREQVEFCSLQGWIVLDFFWIFVFEF